MHTTIALGSSVDITPLIAYTITDMFTIKTCMVVTVVERVPWYASGNQNAWVGNY